MKGTRGQPDRPLRSAWAPPAGSSTNSPRVPAGAPRSRRVGPRVQEADSTSPRAAGAPRPRVPSRTGPRVSGSEKHPLASSRLPKHFVVTGYILDPSGKRVLLLFHRKLQRWLPPGGHVEPDEHPLRALLREVREETGLRVEVGASERGGEEPGVLPLVGPHHLQVETIDGEHEHIDLAFTCRAVGGSLRGNAESRELRWFNARELREGPIPPNVRFHALRLLRTAGGARREVRRRSARARALRRRRRTARSVG